MDEYKKMIMFIKREKRDRHLSLKEMSELAGCYRRTFNSYIHFERNMPADILFNLLNGLGYQITLTKKGASKNERYKN